MGPSYGGAHWRGPRLKLKTSIDLAEYCVRRMKKYAYRARVPWKWAALRADMRPRVPEAELHRWASA